MTLNEFIESLCKNHGNKKNESFEIQNLKMAHGNDNQVGDYPILLFKIGDFEYMFQNRNGAWENMK